MSLKTANSSYYTLRCVDNGNAVGLDDIDGTQDDYERLIVESVAAGTPEGIVVAPNGLRVYAEEDQLNSEPFFD